MAWVLLVIAGLLEVAWASVLPATAGLSRPAPTALFVVLLAGSMYGLARAAETIPIGTAYVVWVGIGAIGTVAVGAFRGEPLTAARLGFLALIVVGVAGLQISGSH